MVFSLEEAQALEESVVWAHHEEALERINDRYEAASAQLRGYSEIIDHQNGLLGERSEIEEHHLDIMERSISLEEQRADRISETVERFQTYSQATITLGNSLAGIFGTLAAREEVGSKAAQEYAEVQGGILAAVSYVQAAIEIAAAIAAGASYQYGSVSEHIAASIAYIAAGTMALTDLGGSATRPSGAVSAGSRYSAQEERDASEREEVGGQVSIYTLGYGSAGLGRELQSAARGYARSGVDRPMIGAGGWR